MPIHYYRTLKHNIVCWAYLLLSGCLLFVPVEKAHAKELHIAVASNFKKTVTTLANTFKQTSNHENLNIKISSASSGTLYAQIQNGAPFDIFFSADTKRPEQLIEQDTNKRRQLLHYAQGQLIIVFSKQYSPSGTCKDLTHSTLRAWLANLKHVVIANPHTAPYGKAALQTLHKLFHENRGLETGFAFTLIRAQNVLHAQHFLQNGKVSAAFLSKSQAQTLDQTQYTYCDIPEKMHSPILQSLLVLDSNNADLLAFIAFLRQDIAKEIIRNNGFLIPVYLEP